LGIRAPHRDPALNHYLQELCHWFRWV